MLTFVDSSVLLSRYLAEETSQEATTLFEAAGVLVTSRVAAIEVRRGLSFIASPMERSLAQSTFAQEWQSLAVVELDRALADLSATIAANTGCRSLDAIHVASAVTCGAQRSLTFDGRQAAAAQTFDLKVVGAHTSEART